MTRGGGGGVSGEERCMVIVGLTCSEGGDLVQHARGDPWLDRTSDGCVKDVGAFGLVHYALITPACCRANKGTKGR